ncbi:hypothetical protein NHP190020_04150 [Helicobacter suis]|uniref:Uncharacterized protein n=1 Tax=Helicobacter suis TaxID=104628 RepID=A0ABM7KY59_9HELI|nr:hypothetical protein NHP190020_04150 [Helicobacter suis]
MFSYFNKPCSCDTDMQDWNLRKNSEFKAFVVVGNKVQENTIAMGHYKVSKNRANLSISVTHIKKGNDYKTLQSPQTPLKKLKANWFLKRHKDCLRR